jgi:endonuclease-3
VPRATPRSKAVAILDALERHHPNADTELAYRTPFELLVATVLSAQSTDVRVNEVTPVLFARFPTAAALAAATPADIEAIIHATGFFRQKAKAVIGLSQRLVADHGGQVPADMAVLVTLPGVGRKTANVVLGHALGVPGLPVDRHVLRVAGRLGLIHTDDAVKAEAELMALWPRERWTRGSDTLILHGRRICRPTPQCPICHARSLCDYAVTGATATPSRRGAARPTRGAARPAARTRAAATRPTRRRRP